MGCCYENRLIYSKALQLLCEKHFKCNDYAFRDSWYLKENAIPTFFDFPSHLKKTLPERKPSIKRQFTEKNQGENEESTAVERNESSSTELLEEQRKKIKVLQQKTRRKEKKIKSFKKELLKSNVCNSLKRFFFGIEC